MKSTAQLRREMGLAAPRETDSLYRYTERVPKIFNPIIVRKSLQAKLPFKSKPKLNSAATRNTLELKRAVVTEPREKRLYNLILQLNTIRNEKAKSNQKRQREKRCDC